MQQLHLARAYFSSEILGIEASPPLRSPSQSRHVPPKLETRSPSQVSAVTKPSQHFIAHQFSPQLTDTGTARWCARLPSQAPHQRAAHDIFQTPSASVYFGPSTGVSKLFCGITWKTWFRAIHWRSWETEGENSLGDICSFCGLSAPSCLALTLSTNVQCWVPQERQSPSAVLKTRP